VKVIVIEPPVINTPLWDGDPVGTDREQYRGTVFYEANAQEDRTRNGRGQAPMESARSMVGRSVCAGP
jgi:hypothetical protein